MSQCKLACSRQAKRTVCKPQCMAKCEKSGRRCKNKATSGFDTSRWPAAAKAAVMQSYVAAGVPLRFGCCSFCEIHTKTLMKGKYIQCAGNVCKRILFSTLPTIAPLALTSLGDYFAPGAGGMGTLAGTAAAFEEGKLKGYTTGYAHTRKLQRKSKKKHKSTPRRKPKPRGKSKKRKGRTKPKRKPKRKSKRKPKRRLK